MPTIRGPLDRHPPARVPPYVVIGLVVLAVGLAFTLAPLFRSDRNGTPGPNNTPGPSAAVIVDTVDDPATDEWKAGAKITTGLDAMQEIHFGPGTSPFVAGGGGKQAAVFEPKDGHAVGTYGGPPELATGRGQCVGVVADSNGDHVAFYQVLDNHLVGYRVTGADHRKVFEAWPILVDAPATWNADRSRFATWNPGLNVYSGTTGQNMLQVPWSVETQYEAVAFSPSGAKLAVVTKAGKASVLDAFGGEWGVTLAPAPADVRASYQVHWSPRGDRIAAIGSSAGGIVGGKVCVWDAKAGGLQLVLQGAKASVYAFAWSPDSKSIAVASNDATRIFDADSGKLLARLPGQADMVAWMFDSKVLATGLRSTRTVQVWNRSR